MYNLLINSNIRSGGELHMKEIYNTKYYTLNHIPVYRQDYITLRLKWLVEILDLKDSDWPIDCMKLLNSLKETQLIPFDYAFIELPDKDDAIAQYLTEHNLYLIFINKAMLKSSVENHMHHL